MILAITMNPAIDKVYAIDDFKIDSVFRPQDMTATAGGKGLNVARVSKLMGATVMATGFVGGSNGEYIKDKVEKLEIRDEFVSVEGETRICINIMDEKNTTSTEILEPGPVITKKEKVKFINYYRKLVDKAEIITASGSLPKGLPDNFYRELIIIAKEKKKKFILDTSGDYLKKGIKEKPFMVKPNRDEINVLMDFSFSSLEDYAKALKKFDRIGIELPVVTLGKKGCLAYINGDVYHYYGQVNEVINTVGSGDAFVSGCAVALQQGSKYKEVIRRGMAYAIANTQFFKTGMVSDELVNKYFESINYTKLNY